MLTSQARADQDHVHGSYDHRTMPKDSSNSRGTSAKGRSKASEQHRDQDPHLANGVGNSADNADGGQDPAVVLASSRQVFQRLANLALYVESCYLDVDAVEEQYGTEIEKEVIIKRLKDVIEEITHSKSQELEKMKQENVKLKAGEDDCQKQAVRCRTMQAELQVQNDQAEQERESRYERKLQDERTRAEKQMKAEKSKMEAAIKEKVQKLEQESKKMLDHNDKLKKDLTAGQQKLEEKDISHTREVKGLEVEHVEKNNGLKDENARLTEELDKAKSEIPVEMQPVQY